MKFIPWLDRINYNKKTVVLLTVGFAITLNIVCSGIIIYFYTGDLQGGSIFSQSRMALSLLSRDVAEGNYRKVMEKFSSESWPNGAKTKSVLFYDTLSNKRITANTEDIRFLCRSDMEESYFEFRKGDYVSCHFFNSGLIVQIVF